MKLTETNGSWHIQFDDGRITYIHIDFRLALDIIDASGNASITIETPCRLKRAEGEVWLTPSESPSLAPILPLFNAKVIGVAVQKTGQLKVEFGDGCTLEVGPDDSYEAWQLGCSPIDVMLVCSPGGNVSFFEQAEHPTKGT
jgi:hypothetical protein